MPENYTIFYVNMPNKVFGFTVYDSLDDFYSIYLNAHHSYYEQQKTLRHELNHIMCGDLIKKADINKIEYVR